MKNIDFDTVNSNLKGGINFSYSRWGDGEWACLLQKGVQNTDHHTYFPDLGKRLELVLKRFPDYYLGLQSLAKNIFQKNERFQYLVMMNHWFDNEIFTRASTKGFMGEFVNSIKKRNVVLVGNHFMNKLPFEFRHVEIKKRNCWEDYSRVKKELNPKENDVIIYCASMMSNILIDDFHHLPITQIDMGSVFDPYVGRNTRTYHKKITHEL